METPASIVSAAGVVVLTMTPFPSSPHYHPPLPSLYSFVRKNERFMPLAQILTTRSFPLCSFVQRNQRPLPSSWKRLSFFKHFPTNETVARSPLPPCATVLPLCHTAPSQCPPQQLVICIQRISYIMLSFDGHLCLFLGSKSLLDFCNGVFERSFLLSLLSLLLASAPRNYRFMSDPANLAHTPFQRSLLP